MADERGMTLPEVLISAVVMVLVFFAVTTFIVVAFDQQKVTENRSDALDDAGKGLERMQRDVRQALQMDPSPAAGQAVSTGVVRVLVWSRTAAAPERQWIRFDCTQPGAAAGTFMCTRRNETAGGPAQPIVDEVTTASGNVFTVRGPIAPAIVPSVDIKFARRIKDASNPVTLQTSVTPRNCRDGLPQGATACGE